MWVLLFLLWAVAGYAITSSAVKVFHYGHSEDDDRVALAAFHTAFGLVGAGTSIWAASVIGGLV